MAQIKAMPKLQVANDNNPVDNLSQAYQSPKLMKALRFDAPADLSISPEEQRAYELNNAEMAKKYPYEPAYLPVARLEDGTMWNW